jgi:hypothetical protein
MRKLEKVYRQPTGLDENWGLNFLSFFGKRLSPQGTGRAKPSE